MANVRPISQILPHVLLERFSEFLAQRVALHFPRERWGDLQRALGVVAKEFGFDDTLTCLQWLLTSPLTPQQIEILASHLTVGETYFFREPAAFAALQRHILPDLMRNRADKRLRIWSAGCSSGEEPYSIAIALVQTLPDFNDWNITLLASDINPRFLQKAAEGVYDNWSFRNVAPALKGYFTPKGTRYFEVARHIKALPTYTHINLADDVYPAAANNTSAMDVIFCRNVLMYFEPKRAQAVIQKLCRALVDGGWLIVGAIETAQVDVPGLTAVRLADMIFYRKGAMPEQPADMAYAYSPAQADEAQAIAPSDADIPSAPPDADAPRRARTYADQGRLADAMYWCNRAIAADKLNPAWPYLLASIQQERGQMQEAIAALERTLYLVPDHVMAHFALGNLLRRQGRQRESFRYLKTTRAILSGYQQEQIVPESEGITAGRLGEIVKSMMASEDVA